MGQPIHIGSYVSLSGIMIKAQNTRQCLKCKKLQNFQTQRLC